MTVPSKVSIPKELELSASVAEKIMGWKNVAAYKGFYDGRILLSGIDSDKSSYRGYEHPIPIPDYASDINCAFLVAEKIGLFKDFVLTQVVDSRWIIKNKEGIERILSSEKTPAAAICVAALIRKVKMDERRRLEYIIGQRVDKIDVHKTPPPSYTTSQELAFGITAKLEGIDPFVRDRFHALYDGFDMQVLERGKPIKLISNDPYEICVAIVKALDEFDQYKKEERDHDRV